MNTTSQRRHASPVGYIVLENGCWEWTGARDPHGYGRWGVDGKMVLTHRWMYELHIGKIPSGFELDHLCRNPPCLNPDHLEPVSHRENCLRGTSPLARNAAKTHCVNGHPFDEKNTYIYPRQPKGCARACRTCRRDHRARATARTQALRRNVGN